MLCPKNWCFTFGLSIFVKTVRQSGVNLSFSFTYQKTSKNNINFCWNFCILINLRTLYAKKRSFIHKYKFIFLFANKYLVLFPAIQTAHKYMELGLNNTNISMCLAYCQCQAQYCLSGLLALLFPFKSAVFTSLKILPVCVFKA